MKHLIWVAVALIALITACKKDEKLSVAIITTTTPSNITANSIQTGGDITNAGGSPISQSGICWAFQNNPSVADSVIDGNQTGTGTFTISMSNLNANTTYYVRAFAINGIGTAYGAVDSFLTAAGVPTVITTAISNNADLMAQSGGSISNTGGAAITAKGVCWSTSANPTISNSKTVDSVGTTSFTDTLTNLTLGVTYYVRAYATSSYGTGYGNQVSFTVSATGTVSDIDGNVYATVTIGTQTWTTSNLKVTHYRNGDPIIDGLTGFDLVNDTTGAYTFPNGDSTQNAVYGKYYNVGAILDGRNIAPVGWHVPTDEELTTLELYEGFTPSDTLMNGGYYEAGTFGGNLLVGGSSGLNLQLAGYYCPGCGAYVSFNQQGCYLSSTTHLSNSYIFLRYFNVSGPGPIERRFGSELGSVRLVKD
jgi:uncharacterized protein (TIGR02145 family)